MAAIQRVTALRDIRNLMETQKMVLNVALGNNDLMKFKMIRQALNTTHQQLSELQISTQDASSGYTSRPKTRRALYTAARDLGLALDSLEYVINDLGGLTEESTYDDRRKPIDDLIEIIRSLKNVTFAPPLPFEKIDRDALIEQIRADSSPGVEQAYDRAAYLAERIAASEPKPRKPTFEALTASEILAQSKQLSTNSKLNKEEKVTLTPLTEERDAEQDLPLTPEQSKALDELFGT